MNNVFNSLLNPVDTDQIISVTRSVFKERGEASRKPHVVMQDDNISELNLVRTAFEFQHMKSWFNVSWSKQEVRGRNLGKVHSTHLCIPQSPLWLYGLCYPLAKKRYYCGIYTHTSSIPPPYPIFLWICSVFSRLVCAVTHVTLLCIKVSIPICH